MAESRPDPVRALEIHRSYLVIAASRHDGFAESACADVVVELERMQEDFGLAEDMVERLSGILQDTGRAPRERAKTVAGLIGEVLELVV